MLAELMNPCCGQFDLSFLRGAEYPKIEERDPFFPKRKLFPEKEIISGKRKLCPEKEILQFLQFLRFFFFLER